MGYKDKYELPKMQSEFESQQVFFAFSSFFSSSFFLVYTNTAGNLGTWTF